MRRHPPPARPPWPSARLAGGHFRCTHACAWAAARVRARHFAPPPADDEDEWWARQAVWWAARAATKQRGAGGGRQHQHTDNWWAKLKVPINSRQWRARESFRAPPPWAWRDSRARLILSSLLGAPAARPVAANGDSCLVGGVARVPARHRQGAFVADSRAPAARMSAGRA